MERREELQHWADVIADGQERESRRQREREDRCKYIGRMGLLVRGGRVRGGEDLQPWSHQVRESRQVIMFLYQQR